MLSAWVLLRCSIALKSVLQLHIVAEFTFTHPDPDQINHLYTSTVDAEPLYYYQQDGYHLVGLRDRLKSERYKTLHKLRWKSYSTVWAARNQRLYKTVICDISSQLLFCRKERYIIIKISVAEGEHNGETREL